MKFVIAPDKYKGSLTAFEFCNAVEEGLNMALEKTEIIKMPLADGGDGTIDVVKHYLKGDIVKVKVNDPLFRLIEAEYLFSEEKKVAYIEMAEASGYKLLKKEELNCMHTTSLGTGELVRDAISKGAKEIFLGIGGSATNDGGMGMATAMGYAFLDKEGNSLTPIGSNLDKVKKIVKPDKTILPSDCKIKVACDVTNPFYGRNGAAHVYGPQKGASKEEVAILDNGLKNFAQVMASNFNVDLQNIPGAGAAGGMGGGAKIFLDAHLAPGIELIKEISGFDKAIKGANWIITGEGKLDDQTLSGKTISGIIKSAKNQNIPVAALCGSVNISVNTQKELGLDYAVSIVKGISDLEEAIASSYTNLVHAAYNFASVLK